jgi:NAD(P)-dependent dehydrogenase (short-subunit alcohol dehydrogenase family)
VNIGSIDGLRPPEHDAFAYAASKAALHHLTQMLAPRLGPRGVVVNALALSAFHGKMSEELRAGRVATLTNANPLGRLGEAADIVGTVLFLMSDDSAFINGAVIPLDGGIRNRPLSYGSDL